MLEIKRSRLSRLRKNEQVVHTVNRLKVATIVFLVLIILVGVVGLLYTWYMGGQPLPETASEQKTAPTQPVQAPKRAVSEDAPVGVALTTITSPVTAPANVMITIKTNPGAACKIDVKYNTVSAQDTGLVPKIADEFGMVQWTWSVPLGTPAGKWPIDITCANKTMSGYYKATLEVAS